MGETVMGSGERRNSNGGGWLSQQLTLPNLVLLGGLIGAGFVVQYRTDRLESKLEAFERIYVPREVNDQKFDHLLYRLNEIDKKLGDMNDARKRGRP